LKLGNKKKEKENEESGESFYRGVGMSGGYHGLCAGGGPEGKGIGKSHWRLV
jgi:hypothetical protein